MAFRNNFIGTKNGQQIYNQIDSRNHANVMQVNNYNNSMVNNINGYNQPQGMNDQQFFKSYGG